MCKPKGGGSGKVDVPCTYAAARNGKGRRLIRQQTGGIVRFIRLFTVEERKEREKRSFRIDNLLADFELV